MKKRLRIAIVCIVLLSGIAALAFLLTMGKKPYKNLTADQIVSARVLLAPPDKTVEIKDLQELVTYLKDVTVYHEDHSYTEYSGQGVTFTLTMKDNTQTTIMTYNPFVVIDGVGYQTKYEPCAALSSYANRLLHSENASIILDEPPALTVVSDETAFDALPGSYSWTTENPDGTCTGGEADCPHPLDCERLLSPPFETTESTAVLQFKEEPDTISYVECWSDAFWGKTDTAGEKVPVDGNVITLKTGGYIYEITAKWNTENGYGGTASYYIYIKTIG